MKENSVYSTYKLERISFRTIVYNSAIALKILSRNNLFEVLMLDTDIYLEENYVLVLLSVTQIPNTSLRNEADSLQIYTI